MSNSPLSYCGTQIKQYDYDRYLTCLFVPSEKREALFALYAFNLEVAKTAELVSEPLTGMIRLQWWRESIESIYAGTPRHHEVVEALAQACGKYNLERALFDAVIDAREFDLEEEPPQSLADLEGYVTNTSSTLLELALQVVAADEGRKPEAREAANAMGLAWGLLGLVRAIPFHAQFNRLYLPQDISASYGLNSRSVIDLKTSPELCAVVKELCLRAEKHLKSARSLRRELATETRVPLLLGIAAERYLKRLAASGYDPFTAEVQQAAEGTTIWRLAWARLRSRY